MDDQEEAGVSAFYTTPTCAASNKLQKERSAEIQRRNLRETRAVQNGELDLRHSVSPSS